MQIEDCYYVGTITRTHGYKGELIVKLDTDDPYYYKNLESVLLEQNGLLVPFFLKSCSVYKNSSLRVEFEGVDEPEFLIGRNLYLPLNTLPPLTGNKFYYHEITGFNVVDEKLGEIGIITGVREANAQDLFEIKGPQGQEILIPIIDDWIVKVDRNKKTIVVKTPDGLLDLF